MPTGIGSVCFVCSGDWTNLERSFFVIENSFRVPMLTEVIAASGGNLAPVPLVEMLEQPIVTLLVREILQLSLQLCN